MKGNNFLSLDTHLVRVFSPHIFYKIHEEKAIIPFQIDLNTLQHEKQGIT